ncbi:MAG: signal recognition particle receptor subunit alpha, partial [Parvibaculum sp.]
MSDGETSTETGEKKKSLFQRMKEGLTRSTKNLSDGITGIFTKKKLDGATLEELEDLLIGADLGLDAAAAITEAVGKDRYDKEVSPEEIRRIVADEIAAVLKPVEKPLEIDSSKKPFVILMTGVNGAGKTTTIGKIG